MRLSLILSLMGVFLVTCPLMAADPITPQALTEELNRHRIAAGLEPLTLDMTLCTNCQNWSNHLAATGRFYHGTNDHVIAYGQSSVREVIADWLRSPGHRAWLLSRNAACGWGVATGRDGRLYWSGAFGSTTTTTTTTKTTTNRQFVYSPSACSSPSCAAPPRLYRQRTFLRVR